MHRADWFNGPPARLLHCCAQRPLFLHRVSGLNFRSWVSLDKTTTPHHANGGKRYIPGTRAVVALAHAAYLSFVSAEIPTRWTTDIRRASNHMLQALVVHKPLCTEQNKAQPRLQQCSTFVERRSITTKEDGTSQSTGSSWSINRYSKQVSTKR